MPSIRSKIKNINRTSDARPDRVDLRDRKYLPRLVNLPSKYPSAAAILEMLPDYESLVLDQGAEGACTGFGLAAMINFLRFREARQAALEGGSRRKIKLLPNISPRMLYENARLYDEWEGEDYEGSSCRGALKGWQRHGVCTELTWPYGTLKNPGKPLPAWRKEAADVTLGAYYRIESDDLTAMQSAICEVGAVYVSADTHKGWGVASNCKSLPVIKWNSGTPKDGGHAFALVGYNQDGFIIQNSWGASWGFHGFALLTYQDWLSNASDAWVATLGVPQVGIQAPAHYSSQSLRNLAGAASRTRGSGTSKTTPWSEEETLGHCLILGNDGRMVRKTVAQTPTEFVETTLMDSIRTWMKSSPANIRIAVYAHGGLNDEVAGIKRASIMGPYLKANGVFPIFIVWKTGWQESLYDNGEDWIRKYLPGLADLFPDAAGSPILDWMNRQLEKAAEVWDRSVEKTLGPLGRSLWSQMKQNASDTGVSRGDHGGSVLAGALHHLLVGNPAASLHLIGHSAGCIWNGHFLSFLRRHSDPPVKVATFHLFAPACTVAFANIHYIKAVESGLLSPSKWFFHLMDDEAERNDTCGRIYRKSLLYFVSRACEPHKTAILGMQAAWDAGLEKREDIFGPDEEAAVRKWLDFVSEHRMPSPNFLKADYLVNDGSGKNPPSHGGFDNDISILNTTLKRILGKNPEYPVTNLSGV